MNPDYCFAITVPEYMDEIVYEYKWYWVDDLREPTVLTGWYTDEDDIRSMYRDAPQNFFHKMYSTKRVRI